MKWFRLYLNGYGYGFVESTMRQSVAVDGQQQHQFNIQF